MRTLLLGESGKTRPIEADAIQVSLQRGLFHGGDIHQLVGLVHRDHRALNIGGNPATASERPWPTGHAVDQRAVHAVPVKVKVSIPFGRPQEPRSISQEYEVIQDIDPGLAGFAEDG